MIEFLNTSTLNKRTSLKIVFFANHLLILNSDMSSSSSSST